MVGSLVMSIKNLLPETQRWTSFENWSAFNKVTDKILEAPFWITVVSGPVFFMQPYIAQIAH